MRSREREKETPASLEKVGRGLSCSHVRDASRRASRLRRRNLSSTGYAIGVAANSEFGFRPRGAGRIGAGKGGRVELERRRKARPSPWESSSLSFLPFPPAAPLPSASPFRSRRPSSLFLSSSRLTFVMLALRQLVEGKVAPGCTSLLFLLPPAPRTQGSPFRGGTQLTPRAG